MGPKLVFSEEELDQDDIMPDDEIGAEAEAQHRVINVVPVVVLK